MNINRHNYEEFFILYMDNELCPGDRRMVEAFVQLHPDLKEELDILLQYKLVPDTDIRFEGKEELLKENGHPLITPGNYDEWLSLYIDDELTVEQKTRVDNFITDNPAVQQELDLLQRTKLQPETIVFEHKDSLYRREEKVRPVVPIRWWRAAAAVLILTAGLSAVFILNKKPGTGKDEVAKTNPGIQAVPAENTKPVQPGKNNSDPVAVGSKNTPIVNPLAAETRIQPDAPVNNEDRKELAISNKKNIVPEKNITNDNPAVIKNDAPVVADNNNKPSNNLPQPLNNPNTSISKPNDAVAYTPVPEKSQLQNALTNNNVTSATAQPSNIIQASYNENEDAVLDQPDGKKNKNRGIFRKIARTFEKRTNIDPTDDNRLLVAGLSIKLK